MTCLGETFILNTPDKQYNNEQRQLQNGLDKIIVSEKNVGCKECDHIKGVEAKLSRLSLITEKRNL